MADDKQQNAWEPLGIRWGVAAGISYPMSRHRSLTDLSSLLAADDAIDSLPDDIASLDFEPLNPQPVAASPPPLPPPLP